VENIFDRNLTSLSLLILVVILVVSLEEEDVLIRVLFLVILDLVRLVIIWGKQGNAFVEGWSIN
jgi:hypothetical protein